MGEVAVNVVAMTITNTEEVVEVVDLVVVRVTVDRRLRNDQHQEVVEVVTKVVQVEAVTGTITTTSRGIRNHKEEAEVVIGTKAVRRITAEVVEVVRQVVVRKTSGRNTTARWPSGRRRTRSGKRGRVVMEVVREVNRTDIEPNNNHRKNSKNNNNNNNNINNKTTTTQQQQQQQQQQPQQQQNYDY